MPTPLRNTAPVGLRRAASTYKSVAAHDQVDYRLAIRRLIDASGLLDAKGNLGLQVSHLEIFRAARTLAERNLADCDLALCAMPSCKLRILPELPRPRPQWNTKHSGAIVSLLVRSAGHKKVGLARLWSTVQAHRAENPRAPWSETRRVRIARDVLENLVPDVTNIEEMGVRKRMKELATGRELWRLAETAINVARMRVALPSAPRSTPPTTRAFRTNGMSGLYLCLGRRIVCSPTLDLREATSDILWSVETIVGPIAGDIGEAFELVSRTMRYSFSECGIAKRSSFQGDRPKR